VSCDVFLCSFWHIAIYSSLLPVSGLSGQFSWYSARGTDWSRATFKSVGSFKTFESGDIRDIRPISWISGTLSIFGGTRHGHTLKESLARESACTKSWMGREQKSGIWDTHALSRSTEHGHTLPESIARGKLFFHYSVAIRWSLVKKYTHVLLSTRGYPCICC
jgi:hypothetical protein